MSIRIKSPRLFAGLALLLSACGGGQETHEFTDIRERKQPRHKVPAALTPAQRLGLERRRVQQRAPLAWTTPAGWEEYEAPSKMRTASWRVSGEPGTDCSLTRLPPQGPAASNVNRWRAEMGLPAIDEAAVAQMPRRKVLGVEGVYVDLTGDFSGGRGTGGALKSARMLGLILQGPGTAVFLKFVGPAHVVAAQEANFEALVKSLVFNSPSGAAMAKLRWDAPANWKEQPKRAMREATYVPEDMPAGWCYIGQIGGGIAPNLNRWQAEMGQPPLSPTALRALPKIPFGGSEGVFLDVEGTFRGTGGPVQQDARLYGFIAARGRMFVFVKMVGPKAQMEAQKERFLALCKSLR